MRERKKVELPEFTSALDRREEILVLAWLPMHLVILPLIFNRFLDSGLDQTTANFSYYAIGFVYMFIVAFRFLRRDFDPLADRPFHCMLEILTGYFVMMCFNFCAAYCILLVFPNTENPNNAEVMDLVFQGFGKMKTTLMFFAPVVEEMMFRAGVFGTLRRRNRLAAYAVSALLFSLYHVWAYALQDPVYWIYVLEYVPVALLLCRCYERTNSIWSCIFFHMMVNGVAVNTLSALQELL